MSQAANYSAIEVMRDGARWAPYAETERQDQLLAAIHRTSPQSLFRRFFAAKRGTRTKSRFFLNIGFVNHVALVAVVNEGSRRNRWWGRYVVLQPDGRGSFRDVDQYQGKVSDRR